MFELELVAGMTATALCFLKGRVRKGFACTAAAVAAFGAAIVYAASTEGDLAEPGTGIVLTVGVALWTATAIVLAWPKAEPGSFWQRRRTVDTAGRLLRDLQPRERRVNRAVAGAVAGLTPAMLFVAVVMSTLEGDEAQLGFLGLYMAAVGIAGGAWIGYQWLPRRSLPSAPKKRQPV
jgi:hypothetical protein